MSDHRPRVLVIDDDPEVLRQASEALSGIDGGADVETEESFQDGLRRVEAEDCDVVVIDLRNGEGSSDDADPDAGNRLAKMIRSHRFVPIVFYTALPNNVSEDDDTPFVTVVSKPDGVTRLREAVEGMLATGVPEATRAVDEHVNAVRRDFLWEFSKEDWKKLRGSIDTTGLSYLLARRLAASLSISGIRSVNAGLGPLLGDEEPGGAHPHFFYVMPPIEKGLRFGDILKENQTFHVILTASCDLVSNRKRKPKAEMVLLARCKRITTQPEFKKVKAGKSNKDLLSVMRNGSNSRQKDRCFFLPPALELPALVLDLQDLRAEKLSSVRGLERIASMDSPFAEMLTSQLARYYGRVGAPDLNVSAIAERLLA